MSDSSKGFAFLALAHHNHLEIPHFSFRGTAKMSDSLCGFANHGMGCEFRNQSPVLCTRSSSGDRGGTNDRLDVGNEVRKRELGGATRRPIARLRVKRCAQATSRPRACGPRGGWARTRRLERTRAHPSAVTRGGEGGEVLVSCVSDVLR